MGRTRNKTGDASVSPAIVVVLVVDFSTTAVPSVGSATIVVVGSAYVFVFACVGLLVLPSHPVPGPLKEFYSPFRFDVASAVSVLI